MNLETLKEVYRTAKLYIHGVPAPSEGVIRRARQSGEVTGHVAGNQM